jgi:hypothetical protein
MNLLVKVRGEDAIIVGFAPGKKGRTLAVCVIDRKLRVVKLRDIELVGYAKFKENKGKRSAGASVTENLIHWSPEVKPN